MGVAAETAVKTDAERFKSAGPTCLPHAPGLVAGAVQLSDVGFFWEAPSNPTFPMVPWAVTANLMIKNTDIRFSMLLVCMFKNHKIMPK